jgi:hypothetical protein
MTAILKRSRGATVDAIDFYCGFGGSAQGIRAAGADLKAQRIIALSPLRATKKISQTLRTIVPI